MCADLTAAQDLESSSCPAENPDSCSCENPLSHASEPAGENLASHLLEIDSRSTLFEKLPPDLRRRLDQAIIDHDPPRYRALHAKFNLAAHGVSFTALYRYARRLRLQADMLHVASLALPDSPDVAESLPTLLAYRLLDALNDESSSPRMLHRLVDAWRIATTTRLALDRQEAALAEDRRKSKNREAEDLCRLAAGYLQLRRADRIAQPSAASPDLQPAPPPNDE
jgi:hypothetical protein